MSDTPPQTLERILETQRRAFTAARPEPLSIRRDRIKRAMSILSQHGESLAEAMNADFGSRSFEGSMMTDIVSTIGFGKYCLKNMDHWAAPDKRSVRFPLGLMGAKAEVRYEPKGVIGIMSPWNFPVNLSFGPLMQVLAAGNRAMIKPSEFTPATSDRMRELVADVFDEDEVAVVTGGPDVAQAFSSLPFDHLVFTGSTATGRKVMEAAAKNLVPVTLELGGKSPTIIGKGADLTRAGERIALGKMLNAGQICLAPDYLLVPEDQEEGVVAAVQLGVHQMYPTLLDNEDYTAIISDKHFERLKGIVEDAKAKGAEAIEVNPANESFSSANTRKMPLTILRNVTDDMKAMQEEIFGPVLPVKTYKAIDEAVDYINDHDRPLGLYYFGSNAKEQEHVLDRTISGGVTVNDVIFHISVEDMPFGGVGPSGIGSYHGPEGFREFSHARSTYQQPKIDIAKLAGLKPPYGDAAKKAIAREMK
ncbi:aldehyde dehydrogenase [Citromicrobium sp. JL31]|uniref:coniferyl aldehyde dehydrogenase n=1 Tax=Citromicrobium sp. JL477 TaxID=1634516 RepID=UPI0001DD0FBA|nr:MULTISPECIES: coniferyl aldehyde dehydrogenase [Citromicrobium]ALG61289.1 aldehyde dehydrogenase [Citromicrobium sp. JL477]KPM12639.1 aldehyde dehydrogenase [Citromicrobium sp. JL1351]KPM13524.1 aldehyde dehydrogenase [Citromicrobium sp. JL31]KPM21481.1 aldehyde dehydrogenase [Citromicrobium sp. JL2201]